MTALFHSPRTISYYFDRSFKKPTQEKSKWEIALEKQKQRLYMNSDSSDDSINHQSDHYTDNL